MKRNVFSYLKLLPLIILLTLVHGKALATAAYVQDHNPWGTTQNITCMNNVFGPGGWTQYNYSATAATIFSPARTFVMMEGSESNDSYLQNFMTANQAAIEAWVNNGGRLFINAAPWYTGNQQWGFNSTVLQFDPSYTQATYNATTAVPTNQIFLGPYTPTATSFYGNYFAHAWVLGTGLTTLLYDPGNPSHSLLCYKTWGNGVVFFGGCTQPNFWTPQAEGINLWQNIFVYVNNIPLTGLSSAVTGSPWCAGDALTVNYSSFNLAFNAGNQFTVQLSDATGSFASPTTISNAPLVSTSPSGSILCTIPAAQAGGTGYRIRTVSTNVAFTGADNGTDLVINPQLVPSVSITAVPGNNICAGTSVTFIATVTNGGPSPTYTWKINNVPVGGNSPTFTSATLNNNDVVTCTINSSAPCATPPTATSNSITMTVNPNVTPTIVVTANPGTTICFGTPVTFTATTTNGGPTPTYQWYKNNFPVGTNSNTYTDNSLVNGDVITCTVTSNAPCASPTTATSTPITITVNPVVTPTISITANPGNNICSGTSVTFSAVITNGGPTPGYAWTLNGNPVGGNISTYTNAGLNNGDVIQCTLTSSAVCATPATIASNTITMTVSPPVTPAVSISVSPGNTICAGTSVTFTATPTNGGPTPTYVWKVNGNIVGSNTNTYTSTTLANGDVVNCTMTTSFACATPATVVSNDITMTVNPSVLPTVSISVNPGNIICAGTSVTFSAAITNGGPTPVYVWKKNGNPVGGNTSTYTDNTLVNGDVITCTLTSNAVCAVPATVTSNAVTMIVNPTLTPAVSIAVTPGNIVCSGTTVTFTATQTNGGPSPVYQWYVNGNPVGSPSPTYLTTTLNNNDVVTCEMTSNALCATPTMVTSNAITMTVNTTVTPTVSVSASPGNVVCSNVLVTFTANTTNAGPTPSYQWKVNGNPVGGNTPTYSSITLNNTDVVSCVVTSNAICASPTVVTSNFVTMTINAGNVPTVVVTANPGSTVCDGTSVTFNATTTFPGPTPIYQWKKNGNPVGGNSTTYTDNGLLNGDVITCTMNSSAPCVSPVVVTSSNTVMTVNALSTPTISVTSNTGDSICLGSVVIFTANPTNGGPSPVYQWTKNGLPVGTNSPTYTDIGLVDNDAVKCVMTSSDLCPVPATVTSNTHTMQVTPTLTPSVYVSVTPGTVICTGSLTTFTAAATGAGQSPTYHWIKNGIEVGSNSPTYTDLLLNSGDSVSCIIVANTACVTKTSDTSAQNVMSWFNSGYLAGTLGLTETNIIKVTPTTDKINYSDCDLMVSLDPSGASPLSGRTKVLVTLDSTVKTYNGQPYLQRHFDIKPDSNADNATATVTLYAYQSEFDAYNAIAGPMGYPLLPSFATDNGNIKVTTFHGNGTHPGNYSGSAEVIVPASVSWDPMGNWWVMTFPVTGFSGYYIHTGTNFPLAIANVNGADGFSIDAYPNPVQDKVAVHISGNRAAHSNLVVTDLTGRALITVAMDNNKAVVDMSGLASGMYMLRYSDDVRTQTIKITKQ